MTIRATYRLQLHPKFGFAEAEALADYLADLRVSHVYLSPVLQAAPGSTHGYDVVDHAHLNAELGGDVAHQRMSETFARRGLSQVLDLVPNHMAIGTPANRWWWDVLENGPASRFASYFDVDWNASGSSDDRILVPVLGDHFGRVLEAGDIKVALEDRRFVVRYFDNVFPASPRSLGPVLADAAERCGNDHLAFLAEAFERLPHLYAKDREDARRRHREKEVLNRLLDGWMADEAVVDALDASIQLLNGDVDGLESFLERQNYRLAYWRSGRHELEYRRFFDIDTLVGLRMEDEEVFNETHARTLGLVEAGFVTGLRIDHVDGLRDPRAYLSMLHRRVPTTWVVVEKILEPGERIPENWPCAGTTGYDFMRQVTGLWIHAEGLESLHEAYRAFTGENERWEELVTDGKRRVLRDGLRADFERLASLLELVARRHRRHRDHARGTLRRGLQAFLVAFPVYRTYGVPTEQAHSLADRAVVETVAQRVKASEPDLDAELVDWLQDLLLFRLRGDLEQEFALRFQQLTGPVMAKGVEDTAIYRFHRLLAVNDVGLDPAHPVVDVDAFHGAMQEAASRAPHAMLTTSTHDTKRSEDVRARLAVLSEIPDEWGERAAEWNQRAEVVGVGRVERSVRYAFFQTVVGAWPIDADRLEAYFLKLVREAKLSTSWTRQDDDYEAAVVDMVRKLMDDDVFLSGVEAFVGRIADAGWVNSTAQALVKLTSPGVPDIYQGCEMWDLSLVDPDNRRPVDYATRRAGLKAIAELSPEEVWQRRDEGLPKLYVTRAALRLRAELPFAFDETGSYDPIPVKGEGADRVLAFARGGRVVTVVPRFVLAGGSWGAPALLELPEGSWVDVLTDEIHEGRVSSAELFRRFPVALLRSSRDEAA
jgi:(1->4)-alpha-D-glucan 1-alpha-D-glucosylmutase